MDKCIDKMPPNIVGHGADEKVDETDFDVFIAACVNGDQKEAARLAGLYKITTKVMCTLKNHIFDIICRDAKLMEIIWVADRFKLDADIVNFLPFTDCVTTARSGV